jgi:hypothetical protein
MHVKRHLAIFGVVMALLAGSGSGLAAEDIVQPPQTPYMRSTVGTPDELSPLAPAEARQVKKMGDKWTCILNGQLMVYNEAASRWEPQSGPLPRK